MNLFPAISEQIMRNPDLIKQAQATLARWAENGLAPSPRIAQWRALLQNALDSGDGMEALRRLLLDESEAAKRLKDFAPFAGLLSREERRKVFLKCAYDH
jgi:hypothetical protein